MINFFSSKLVISSNLLPSSLLNIFFLLWDQWTIFMTISIFCNCFNISLVLNCYYLSFSLVFNCFCLFLESFFKGRISKLSLFYYLLLIRWWYFFTSNPNLGWLFKGLFLGWGGVGVNHLPHPCLKLVRFMLETSNFARTYTPIYSFRKHKY